MPTVKFPENRTSRSLLQLRRSMGCLATLWNDHLIHFNLNQLLSCRCLQLSTYHNIFNIYGIIYSFIIVTYGEFLIFVDSTNFLLSIQQNNIGYNFSVHKQNKILRSQTFLSACFAFL